MLFTLTWLDHFQLHWGMRKGADHPLESTPGIGNPAVRGGGKRFSGKGAGWVGGCHGGLRDIAGGKIRGLLLVWVRDLPSYFIGSSFSTTCTGCSTIESLNPTLSSHVPLSLHMLGSLLELRNPPPPPVGCSSPFMRLAEHLTALCAWCKQCLPGR